MSRQQVPLKMVANNAVASANIVDGTVAAGDLAAGAASANVGALGGALSGTLPNPTLAGGGGTSGPAGGALTGTYPNPTLAANSVSSGNIVDATIAAGDLTAGAAATNVGTLGGVLGGTLPNPTMAAGAATTNVGALSGVLGGTLPSPTMAAGAAATNVGTLGGVLSGTLPNPTLATGSVTGAMIADGSIATADLANATVTNAKLASDTARANLLTNGSFEVWQRGLSGFATNNAYTADRWFMGFATSALNVAYTPSTIGTGGKSAQLVYSHVGGGYGLLQQYIEGGQLLVGKTLTLTAKVKSTVAGTVYVAFTNQVTNAASAPNVGTGEETLTATYTVSASGASLSVYFFLNVASCTVEINDVMVVVGSQGADYAPLHPGDEQGRCERYYEVIGTPSTGYLKIAASANGAHPIGTAVVYKAEKPVTPTTTKVGTWTVANCGQPGLSGNPAKGGTFMFVSATAAGAVDCTPGAGCFLTIEAN